MIFWKYGWWNWLLFSLINATFLIIWWGCDDCVKGKLYRVGWGKILSVTLTVHVPPEAASSEIGRTSFLRCAEHTSERTFDHWFQLEFEQKVLQKNCWNHGGDVFFFDVGAKSSFLPNVNEEERHYHIYSSNVSYHLKGRHRTNSRSKVKSRGTRSSIELFVPIIFLFRSC